MFCHFPHIPSESSYSIIILQVSVSKYGIHGHAQYFVGRWLWDSFQSSVDVNTIPQALLCLGLHE